MTTHRVEDREVDYISHFQELHTRLLYCILALLITTIAGWFLYPQAYHFIAGPVLESVQEHGGKVVTLHPAEAFFARMKFTAMLGLVLASPVVVWQLWMFVRPGLTTRERRIVGPLIPAICVLFLTGALIAHLFMPQVMTFFIGYNPDGVAPMVSFANSFDLPLKIILAFGLGFQLPIVLLGLILLRVITPAMLLAQWRSAVVVIAILAAVLAPGDPLSWAMTLVLLTALYFGTVLIAFRLVKPATDRKGN